ncbi:MAG: hypothetical protein NUW37_14355 [Planctomycetes bacterium]|nr:hypothetical protein [Planctomycetota bacterium]
MTNKASKKKIENAEKNLHVKGFTPAQIYELMKVLENYAERIFDRIDQLTDEVKNLKAALKGKSGKPAAKKSAASRKAPKGRAKKS